MFNKHAYGLAALLACSPLKAYAEDPVPISLASPPEITCASEDGLVQLHVSALAADKNVTVDIEADIRPSNPVQNEVSFLMLAWAHRTNEKSEPIGHAAGGWLAEYAREKVSPVEDGKPLNAYLKPARNLLWGIIPTALNKCALGRGPL